MKYDAEEIYKKARKEGAGLKEICPCPNYDCRYKTAEEIAEDMRIERRRNFGEAVGCTVFLILATWLIFLIFCM